MQAHTDNPHVYNYTYVNYAIIIAVIHSFDWKSAVEQDGGV